MSVQEQADRNVRAFLVFRIFFNARFYYPVLAILFLDLGLSLEQYSLLNVAWATSIFLLEVPSGALADIWGRKKLVVIAGGLMVLEMLIFSFAPSGNPTLLFNLFLLNRVLSGAAEASASGADEALVYDSLKNAGREREWPQVLAKLGRWQSISFFVVMLVGAAVYDPATFAWIGNRLGKQWTIAPADLVRVPVYLTLLLSFVACAATFRMFEAPVAAHQKVSLRAAMGEIANAAKWIIATPIALFVILATLCNDSFIRLFMTMTSQYFRVLHLPEASFGLIGSISALLGFVSPWAAQALIKGGSARRAFALLSVATLGGLYCLRYANSAWSLGFVFWLSLLMGIVGYLSSHYLNEIADPKKRATILSFRGLSGNLAYGALGVLFAGLLKSVDHQNPVASESTVFVRALTHLPWIFAVMILLTYAVRAKVRKT